MRGMECLGLVVTTGECFHPQLSDILAQDTDKQEDVETLECIEDHKEDLESK